MFRLFAAVIFVGMFLLMTHAHAEIKTYEGYGETALSEIENPEFAKMRAKDAAVRDAKDKAAIDLLAFALSKNLPLTEEEIFTVLNNNIKFDGETRYEDDIINHSEKTSVVIFKAYVKINVDTDSLSNWLNFERSTKDTLLEQNKTAQELSDEDRKKIEDLQRRAQNAKTPEEIAKIKAEFEQLNNNYLAMQKYIAGNVAYSRNQFDDALKFYGEALEINPNFGTAYNNRGTAYFNLKNYEVAGADFTKAIELNPNNATAYGNRGDVYRLTGNQNAALDDYSKAIKLAPNNAIFYNNRGITYFNLKNYEYAIADFTEAIKLNPNNATAYGNRGDVHRLTGNFNAAVDDYSKAIELAPNNVVFYNNRGVAYFNLKNYEVAGADFTKAIELNPNYATAYCNRGDVHRLTGNFNAAVDDYSKAIEL
ncbi:MAG: tetratricopeptide repeat protein, partial [Selenomonadaceae bacterium]|nr:tetratricopeptide repeat protein [Selenomonadaceae bacterium]